MRDEGSLPRIWYRNFDDVFVIARKNDIQKSFDHLNNQFDSITFTCKIEKYGKILCLDLLVERENDSIEFGIYHKSSSTMRTITSNYHCPIQYNKAAYHAMVHFCRIPMTVTKHKRNMNTSKKQRMSMDIKVK